MGLVLAGALVAGSAGCSRGGDGAAPSTTLPPVDDGTTTTAPPAGPPAVLTGLPIADSKNLDRPALVVKIDNAPAARPQSGVHLADVVYEEVVEGGAVRFMAVFQSQDADVLGPVRSVRPVDADIVWPIGGLFAYSGGTAKIEAGVKKAPVRIVSYRNNEHSFERKPGKRAPHNVYTSTKTLYEKAKDSDKAPPALFTFAAGGASGGAASLTGRAATHATVVMGGPTTAAWDWDPGLSRWKRTTNGTAHTMEDGPQLAFANVVVQYVRYTDTAARDPAGFAVPTADVTGTGDVLVLAGGTQVKGKWSKPKSADVTEFRDQSGAPIQLLPGPTWVMLAPVGAPTTLR